MAYNANIPNPGDLLSASQADIKNNFTQANTSFGIDHLPFTDATAQLGYHKTIHMKPSVGNPAAVAGIGEVYCRQINSVNTDEALYYQSGGGRVYQMTMNTVPVASTNGYSFLPGGLLVQWGQITSTASSFTALNFATNNINFPNNCFAVFTQPFGSGTPPGGEATVQIRKSTLSNTKFDWAYVTNSGQYTGFFWWAIGN